MIGKLTIFTSYTPGAGKSYLMLQRAMEQRSRGKKVVIGFFNRSHRDTQAQMADIGVTERIPKRYALSKIIAAAPELVVLDELGMRGINRETDTFVYEDVETLLNLGIDVYTSANIKRFADINPSFKAVTGIGIKKTIPDRFLVQAHRICFVDRAPEQMQQDFADGSLFGEKYMQSNIMQKNFRLKTLHAYRQISLDYLKAYGAKVEIVPR